MLLFSAKWARSALFMVVPLFGLSGCLASVGLGPARLFSVDEETTAIKAQVGPIQFSGYYSLPPADRARYRNEYVGARMYGIDLAYSEFETALRREMQETGFAATATNLGLTTATTLLTPTATKNVLSAVASAVTGLKAAYGEDVLRSHTMELILTQMRANRANAAATILRGMQLPADAYSLAAAASDLEAYYQAGTVTSAIVKLSETVSTNARNAEITKSDVVITARFTRTEASAAINAFMFTSGPNGPVNAANRQKLVDLIVADGNTPEKAAALLGSAIGGGQPQLAAKLAAAIQKGL